MDGEALTSDAEGLDEKDVSGDEDVLEATGGFPETASTRARAATAWWFLLLGPVLVAASGIVAGFVADERAAQLTIVLAVFLVMWIIGSVASPKVHTYWWAVPIAVAFVAAAAMVGLLALTNVASPTADSTTTTTTTSTTATTASGP